MLNATAVRSNLVTSLVIFDSQVADLPLLYNALLPGSIGHTIQPDRDPIDTITNLLTETGATKLAIVAHGQPGAIQIGNGQIDRAMLETRSGLLQEWGLDSIALYSCEVGADVEFIQRLGELTGAQVSASTGKLGAGNWELDGGMELLSIEQLADYNGTLATFTGTAGDDSASPFSSTPIIGFTGGTLAELTDTIGDIFYGLDGSDFVFARYGDDIIIGGAGNDSLSGSDGNDIIDGGAGSNFLYGDDGDDRINAGSMSNKVDGGSGNDFLFISTSSPVQSYTIEFTGATAGEFKINGTETGTFTDIEQLVFLGNVGNDVINANLANLIVTPFGAAAGYGTYGLNIDGFSGSDTVLGSANADDIDGGSDNDFLYGQGGNDLLNGDFGLDIIFGGSGVDDIRGGYQNDTIFGGSEGDIISGQSDNDFLYGDDGNDTINGGNDNDFLFGQAGNDTLNGDAGNDYIFGGIGVDIISGGLGTDEIYGEDGDDRIFGQEDTDFLFGQAGDDTLYGDAGNDYLVGGEGGDYLLGGNGVDQLNGENGNDYLFGDGNDDFLYGNDGFDTLYGNEGNDVLDGGSNDDFLYGGVGGDVLFGGEGNDILSGEFSPSDPGGVDYLYGGNGNDRLYGQAGADFLIGGAGSDTFYYELMTDAGDTITDFNPLVGGDKLDFTYLFAHLPVVVPSGSVNTNYLKFTQLGTDTICQIDSNGLTGGVNFVTMAILNGVTATNMITGINVFV
jgi:Ca2+-binding RTX toxin-like protein